VANEDQEKAGQIAFGFTNVEELNNALAIGGKSKMDKYKEFIQLANSRAVTESVSPRSPSA
jgi:hypothetical protein